MQLARNPIDPRYCFQKVSCNFSRGNGSCVFDVKVAEIFESLQFKCSYYATFFSDKGLKFVFLTDEASINCAIFRVRIKDLFSFAMFFFLEHEYESGREHGFSKIHIANVSRCRNQFDIVLLYNGIASFAGLSVLDFKYSTHPAF